MATVTVKLLDAEYQVSCEDEEVDSLMASARDLDTRMRSVREGGKLLSVERVLVLVALNTARDNILANRRLAQLEEDAKKLADRVDRALAHAASS